MKSSVERLTSRIGRLYHLKLEIKGKDFQVGDIFLLTDVKPLVPKLTEETETEGDKAFQAKLWAHYPDAVLCQLICGEKEHLHAASSEAYFYDYFEQIPGV